MLSTPSQRAYLNFSLFFLKKAASLGKLPCHGDFRISSFFISIWPIEHMKTFFEKIKHIAHRDFAETNEHIKGFE